jgi:hypothetical protein
MRPYTDFEGGVREFSAELNPEELMWHRDNEDRVVEPVGNTDWKLQLDNELPILLKNQIFIPRGMWHRAIKGTGSLRIKITKK